MKNNSQSQFKKNFYPVWFPYPTSWLKAFVLALFLTISSVVFIFTNIFGYLLARLVHSPELLVIFLILALLSPIAAIAFTHHLFHRLIGKLFPSIQAPEIGNPQGFLPGLISWWEGLFGWLVIALSTLISLSIIIFITPLFDLDYQDIDNYYYYWNYYSYYWDSYYWYHRNNIMFWGEIIWIICAAVIYQIEYLFKRKMITTYANSNLKTNQPNNQLNESQESIDIELNRLRGESGLNQVKPGKQSSQLNSQTSRPRRKVLSNNLIILPVLFSVVVGGIYIFSNVLPSRETVLSPSTVSSVPPTVTPSPAKVEAPQIDLFPAAVNHAMSAAKLAQAAKSREEWIQVVEQWQKAIALMKSVPTSSANYAVAQKKAVEYQSYIDYAKTAANKAP